MKWYIIIIVQLLFVTQFNSLSQDTSKPFQTITAENLSNLELGYAVPGHCLFGGISPDGEWLASDNVVYDVESGTELFLASGRVVFSPNRRWIAIENDGVYRYPSLDMILSVSTDDLDFSPNSEFIFIAENGIYQLESVELVIPTSSETAIFSPDSQYVAIDNEGLFRLDTLENLMPDLELNFFAHGIFSPNSQLISLQGDGVYSLPSLEKQFTIPSTSDSYGFIFSPNSRYFILDELGVFDLTSGEQIISSFILDATFDRSSSRVYMSNGIYDLKTGEKTIDLNITTVALSPTERFILSEAGIFSAETGERIIVPINSFGRYFFNDEFFIGQGGVYYTDDWQPAISTTSYGLYPAINEQLNLITYSHSDYSRSRANLSKSGSSCLLYGIEGNPWQYRSGVVFSDNDIDVYESSIETDTFVDKAGGEMIVYEISEDRKWFKILSDTMGVTFGWIRAQDVETIFMPEGIPIENE